MPGCVSLCTHLRTCGQTLEVAAGLSLPPCLHSLYQALPVCYRAMRPRRLHCWRLVWPTWWLQGCTPAISCAQMCTSCWEAPGACLREVQTLLLGEERWRGGGWQCTHCCWGTSSNRLCRRVSKHTVADSLLHQDFKGLFATNATGKCCCWSTLTNSSWNQVGTDERVLFYRPTLQLHCSWGTFNSWLCKQLCNA